MSETGLHDWPKGCGYTCPYRDAVNGRCSRHGPTQEDLIVQRVTDSFKADLKRIMSKDPEAQQGEG